MAPRELMSGYALRRADARVSGGLYELQRWSSRIHGISLISFSDKYIPTRYFPDLF